MESPTEISEETAISTAFEFGNLTPKERILVEEILEINEHARKRAGDLLDTSQSIPNFLTTLGARQLARSIQEHRYGKRRQFIGVTEAREEEPAHLYLDTLKTKWKPRLKSLALAEKRTATENLRIYQNGQWRLRSTANITPLNPFIPSTTCGITTRPTSPDRLITRVDIELTYGPKWELTGNGTKIKFLNTKTQVEITLPVGLSLKYLLETFKYALCEASVLS